jgi:hypothetical protein
MLADVGGEYLDDLGVIVLRVFGDALQRVDAAQAHVDCQVPQLLDRLREPVGDLPCAIERERPRRVERADHGKTAGKQR